MFADWLQRQWFSQRRPVPALWLLLPLWAIFVAVSSWRRWRIRAARLPVPVVVVGNILVGGAGKTPLTIALALQLRAAGRRPGVVSRGYGRERGEVCAVSPDASPAEVGDEPLLIARRTGCPVWVGRDRVAAARQMLAQHPEIDVVLCDDGLQHYRLGRDVEIAVFDARGLGNGWRLPLGPLREPLARLQGVDCLVFNGAEVPDWGRRQPAFVMRLQPGRFYRLDAPHITCSADQLRGKPLHAVAGMGYPQRFFTTLNGLGLSVVPHAFPDHHAYALSDLRFAETQVLLMTEKDAVKCAALKPGEAWVLPIEADLPPAFVELILEKLRGRQVA